MTHHPSYGYKESFLYAGSDDIIPGMNKLARACREFDTPVFGQLFHAGRAVRLSHDGSRPLTYSASDIPDERYRVIARTNANGYGMGNYRKLCQCRRSIRQRPSLTALRFLPVWDI